ncbi:PREDICTED: probable glutamate--tRNA ligase, mitochondrial [Dinoponera quadriceps]|uniref:Nondiscriminating glutamyl-tRNA synthetase EARS2, mitochondrial n=1 Tax=Dinoponera quadriceps TaxID=609295 RepID=A0A6P3X3L9_DINQU|nr:PREDICTED: probable glutamate--tRNA ligase, mitochondrial [Dinoponera quadriceps]XP_014472957.1 PREDICTED: probable glutamate--tRNA ligase, mitochondrial [Dinoponera quadriceps]XP_014472958.1 PREDICTED: probable glutamate--tRNA ligase, mitochondrial [Dinoponera quadriceps]XP_014472959.1 PREDICTED: probable glutamate--tRNA ligase, mitochondrial [Dinoponera quadriceps]XP_014472960.1 PREDICTED: probable glutamate--tRNA ligase, mitochondrial [Dinoponera quadriceps]
MQRNILQAVSFQVLHRRFFKKHHVRVRFAPSPTGYLHLGGLRTALYNYLFARSQQGAFILRIEDTDQTRIVPGAMKKLQDDLSWAGIISDEDPIRGGPLGPYIQSGRLELYQKQVLKLLDNGSAYYCFCTEQRLALIKNEALRCRQVPKYDNRCRHYSKDEVKEMLKKNLTYCVRFKLPSTPESFHDMVYGDILHDISKTEGDPVIIKSDGYPTYHFANVVDDHFMEISHVLRGVEWQVSTSKHIMLYKAFGWDPPAYGHLPLILNTDRSKLSKRQSDIDIESFRKQGIFPLALVNYVISAGGGGFHREEEDQILYSYEELIKKFDISKIKLSSGKLMPEKLLEFNKLEITNLLKDEENHSFLIERVKRLVQEAFPEQRNDGSLQLDDHHIITTLKWAQNRICNLNDLVKAQLAFLWIVPVSAASTKQIECSDAIKLLNAELVEMDVNNYKTDWIGPYLRNFADNKGIPFAALMKNLRSILSGAKDGPPVAEMMEILGKDRTLLRLRRFVS